MSRNCRHNFHEAPNLNLDVFDIIYAFLRNHRETWSMMQTCQSLYRLGIPHLLASSPHPIFLSDACAITSFCSFMLAESFSNERFRAFRSLTIEPSFSDNGDHLHVASDLVRVFKRASHLETLVIWGVPEFLGLWPEIQRFAVNSLPSLCTLVLDNPDDRSIQLLNAMTSPLRILKVLGSKYRRRTTNLPALSNMATTLTTLISVRGIDNSEYDAIFPQMRVLDIHSNQLPSITHLIRAFPNLTELSFQTTIFLDHGDLQPLRLRNRKNITALGNLWTSLDSLAGNLDFLYSIGLSCPAHRLNILSTVEDSSDLEMLLELLDGFHPRRLDVSLNCQAHTARSIEITFLRPLLNRVSPTCRLLSIHLLVDYSIKEISKLKVVQLLKTLSIPC